VDSIVYDVFVEENGSADGFQKEIGRLRLREGMALAPSAFADGGIAAPTSPWVTNFLTVPLVVLPNGVLATFTEPGLHRRSKGERWGGVGVAATAVDRLGSVAAASVDSGQHGGCAERGGDVKGNSAVCAEVDTDRLTCLGCAGDRSGAAA
jgi:hypothetical protein